MNSIGARIAWWLALAALASTGFLGIRNGIAEWPEAQNALQRSVTGGVFVYGIFGAASAYGLWRGRRWSMWTTAAWGVAILWVGSAAVPAYGGPDVTRSAAVAAGMASLLIAGAVFWAVRSLTAPR